MKKVTYSPGILAALGKKKGPIRVPADVLVEQVTASMAIEGRMIATKLTVKPTQAASQAVATIAARSIERRKSGSAPKA